MSPAARSRAIVRKGGLLRPRSRLSGKPVALPALTNFEVLIDRTSIETFTNDGAASMSKCFLPTENGFTLRATGDRAVIKQLKLIYLKSAWE